VVQGAFWAEAAFQAKVPTVLVELHQFVCASSMTPDSWLYHLGMEGSPPVDFYKSLPGVLLSQTSPRYTQPTKHLASSLLSLLLKVS
jgi:hypothetical protein